VIYMLAVKKSITTWDVLFVVLVSAILTVIWHLVGLPASFRLGEILDNNPPLWKVLWSRYLYENYFYTWWSGICLTFVTFCLLPIIFCTLVIFSRALENFLIRLLVDVSEELQVQKLRINNKLIKYMLLTIMTISLALLGYILREILDSFGIEVMYIAP